MKTPLLLITSIFLSTSLFANKNDGETLEYCKHKYEQVTLDVAMKEVGCKFSNETQKHIIQNRNNTYLNCAPYLNEQTRINIGKSSLAAANALVKKFGLKDACEYNASLYPGQISN